jgi:hypothetical protein
VLVEGLSEAEHAVWDAFPTGDAVDLRGAVDSVVRAEVLAALLLGGRAGEPGRVPAVRLSGASVIGSLDLSFAEVQYAMLLMDCAFAQQIVLYGARTRQVNLSGSRFPGMYASDAQIGGLLWLARCSIDGPLKLTGTQVDGSLSLCDALVTGDPAIAADSLTVRRDFACTDATVVGEFLVRSARIAGTAVFDRSRIDRPDGIAFNGNGLIVERGLFGGEGFTCSGETRLEDARIGRVVAMTGARLHNSGGIALNADGLRVDGSLLLNDGFMARGEVTMQAAVIGGTLLLHGADLVNPSGRALNAHLITIETSLRASRGFTAAGEIYLDAAYVKGSINLDGAQLMNPGRRALRASRIEVTGGLFCGNGFSSQGDIRLADARIGSRVVFSHASLSNPGGSVLAAPGIGVGGTMEFGGGFVADGDITMSSAKIADDLSFEDAGQVNGSIDCKHIRAARLTLTSRVPLGGTLDLRHAQIGVLHDDPANWPALTLMDGCTYESLETPLSAQTRLAWLASADRYQPQPYEQLAAVYKTLGQDADARTVLLAKQRCRRLTLPLWNRIWGLAQDWTVGYGYRPLRAGLWLAGLFIIGTIAFSLKHPSPLIHNSAQSCAIYPGPAPSHYQLRAGDCVQSSRLAAVARSSAHRIRLDSSKHHCCRRHPRAIPPIEATTKIKLAKSCPINCRLPRRSKNQGP